MNNLIDILHTGNFSCVIANGDDIRTFTRRGVADIYYLLNCEPEFLQNASLADKIIGKGVAALMIDGGVKKVYADILSQSALNLFRMNNIEIQYAELVHHIKNRDKSDWCPLEKSCKDTDSLLSIRKIIDIFIKKMSNNNLK